MFLEGTARFTTAGRPVLTSQALSALWRAAMSGFVTAGSVAAAAISSHRVELA